MEELEPTPRPTYIRVDLSVHSVLLAVGAVAVVALFLQLWPILLVILVALMMAGALGPTVEQLERWKIGRPYAISIVFTGLLALAVAFGAVTLPTLADQVAQVVTRLPETKQNIADFLAGSPISAPFARSVRETRIPEIVAEIRRFGFAYSPKLIEVVAYSLSALFLALYLLIDRDRMRGSAFAFIPRAYHLRASRVMLKLEVIVGGYIRGQIITSLLMMVFTFIVLTIANVPNALALALFAGLADVLPYIGALLACAPAFFAATTQGTTTALVVLAVLAAYQEFESRYIIPRVYGRTLRLPAAAVMIALLIGGKLLGILGALLALPIAAGARMMMKELHFTFPGDDVHDLKAAELEERLERDFEARSAGTNSIESAAIAAEIAARIPIKTDPGTHGGGARS